MPNKDLVQQNSTWKHLILIFAAKCTDKGMFKFMHIILAFNVLLSTSGITVFEHLCQMKGKTVSVFAQPKGCCASKKMVQGSCQKKECNLKGHQHHSLSKKPCCEDKSHLLKSTSEGTTQLKFLFDYHFDLITVNSPNFVVWSGAITPTSQKALRFYLYKPPPVATDIRVFIQSFLC